MACARDLAVTTYADDTEFLACPVAGRADADAVVAHIRALTGVSPAVNQYGLVSSGGIGEFFPSEAPPVSRKAAMRGLRRQHFGDSEGYWYVVSILFRPALRPELANACATVALRMDRGWATFCSPSGYVAQFGTQAVPADRSYVAHAGVAGSWSPFPGLPGSSAPRPGIEFGVFERRITKKEQTAGILPY